MSDINTEKTLAAMLRDHDTELDVIRDVAAALTARLMKQSTLTAEGIGEAAVHPVLASVDAASLQSIREKEPSLATAAAEAAEELKTRSQALIQGNLTAEKVSVTEGQAEVAFEESSLAGPLGYDIASLMVSGLMGWCHGNALIEDDYEKDDFCDCCLDLVSDLADQFVWNYDGLYEELATAASAKEEGFKASFMSSMMPDLAAAAGLEALRVLTGKRPSAILTEIPEGEKQKEAEAVILAFAATCILEKDSFFCGADFAAAIESAARTIG